MTKTEISDEELIRSSRSGDTTALEALYSRHHGAGLRYARRLMPNNADAEDVAQEAFLKVAAAMDRGNGPKAMFRPYLLRTVRTVAADRWNGQAKETPVESTPDSPADDAALEAVLHRDDPGLAIKAFQSLPPRWMTVLWHAEVEREPPRRIAPLLGMEPGAVSALLLRARKGLREAYLSAYAAAPPRTDCEPSFPYLAATVLGTGASRDRKKVKEHTRECEDCAKVLAELTDVGATMRGILAPLFLAPAGVALSGGTPALLPKGNTPWLGMGLTTAAVAASVAVAAVAGSLGLGGASTPAPAVPATQPAVPQIDPVQETAPQTTTTQTTTTAPPPGPGSPAVPVLPVNPGDYPTSGSSPAAESPAPTGTPSGAVVSQSPAPTQTPAPSRTPSPTATPTATPSPTPTATRPPCTGILFFCMPRVDPPPKPSR